jgi:hypothetical protein
MRHAFLSSSLLAAAIFCVAPVASSGQEQPTVPPKKYKIIHIVPKKQFTPEDLAKIGSQNAASKTIPLWTYFVKGYDSVTYGPGYMVGRAPYAHGHRSTTIPTYLIPVIFTFADTGTVFDPTSADACSPNGGSVLSLVEESPLFQNAPFTMNGVSMGSRQYLDAFQRGNFWSYVAGTPYQTVFSSTPTVLPAVSVTVPSANGSTQFGVCGLFGAMEVNWWDNLLQTTIIPSLASHGVGPANFPQFVFDSVVMYDTTISNCCALGYHNSYMNGGVFQTYSANDFDTSGVFGGDTSVMSHEIGEWLDDPNGMNLVPKWGAEGQVPSGSCQNNLEVGDPLSPNPSTPTNPFSVLMPNGVTYTLQELAYFSWFYGGPSVGSGSLYSDNGTFKGNALACPPGGTH